MDFEDGEDGENLNTENDKTNIKQEPNNEYEFEEDINSDELDYDF